MREKTALEILEKEKEHHGPVWKVQMCSTNMDTTQDCSSSLETEEDQR